MTHALRRAGTVAETAVVGPGLLRINPTGFICNHTCPMCFLQHIEPQELKRLQKVEREEAMKLADYRRLFDSMPAGLREVNIVGGGEPLIHSDIVSIMVEIKQHGWIGSLISNGSLLKEPIARQMLDMQWNSTRISVHAGDAETYRKIQGVDRFDTVVSNIKTFNRLRHERGLQERCTLVIFHVLQKDNLNSIDRLFAVAEEVGADFIEFDKVFTYPEGEFSTHEEFAQLRQGLSDCAKISKVPCNTFQILPELIHEEPSAVDKKPFVPAKRCSVGFDQSFITATGDVLPCCFSNEIMGNVRREKFRDIWFGEKYDGFRKRMIHGKFAGYCIKHRCALPDVLHH